MIVPHIPATLGDAAAPLAPFAPLLSLCDAALDAIQSNPTLAAFRAVDLLPAAGITLILMALLMGYRKRRARSAGPRRTPAEELERARQLRGMRGDLEQLMVEIEQLAKRFATQLDAKTIELEEVCADADRKIAELKQLMAKAETMGVAPHRHGDAGEPDAEDASAARGFARPSGHPRASDSPDAANESTPTPATHSDPDDPGDPDDNDAAEAAADPLARSVYRLADQGLDPPAIAGKLNEHVGKIELILALRTT